MSRRISFYAMQNGDMRMLDRSMEVLGIGKRSPKDGLTITGCGMDMGFHSVYSLGRAIWPNGTPEAHGMRNGDGGYALKHVWL